MISILAFLTGLIGSVSNITQAIVDLQKAKVSATTNVEKEDIDRQIEDLHDKRQVLIAEAGNRINGIMRFVLAIGPAAYLTKIFLYDKVIGAFLGCSGNNSCITFNTDPLDVNLWWVVVSVVGFFFLSTYRWPTDLKNR